MHKFESFLDTITAMPWPIVGLVCGLLAGYLIKRFKINERAPGSRADAATTALRRTEPPYAPTYQEVHELAQAVSDAHARYISAVDADASNWDSYMQAIHMAQVEYDTAFDDFGEAVDAYANAGEPSETIQTRYVADPRAINNDAQRELAAMLGRFDVALTTLTRLQREDYTSPPVDARNDVTYRLAQDVFEIQGKLDDLAKERFRRRHRRALPDPPEQV